MISQDALAIQATVAYPEPSFPEAEALERAEAFLASGLVSEAAEIYEEMIERGLGSPRAQLGLAQCAYRLRHLHEALGHLQAALLGDPDHPSVHNDLGVVLFELGMIDEARAAFLESVAKNPGDTQPLRNLMDVAVSVDDWDACIEHCRGILALAPDDEEVQRVLEAARLRAEERARPSKRATPERRGYRVISEPVPPTEGLRQNPASGRTP